MADIQIMGKLVSKAADETVCDSIQVFDKQRKKNLEQILTDLYSASTEINGVSVVDVLPEFEEEHKGKAVFCTNAGKFYKGGSTKWEEITLDMDVKTPELGDLTTRVDNLETNVGEAAERIADIDGRVSVNEDEISAIWDTISNGAYSGLIVGYPEHVEINDTTRDCLLLNKRNGLIYKVEKSTGEGIRSHINMTNLLALSDKAARYSGGDATFFNVDNLATALQEYIDAKGTTVDGKCLAAVQATGMISPVIIGRDEYSGITFAGGRMAKNGTVVQPYKIAYKDIVNKKSKATVSIRISSDDSVRAASYFQGISTGIDEPFSGNIIPLQDVFSGATISQEVWTPMTGGDTETKENLNVTGNATIGKALSVAQSLKIGDKITLSANGSTLLVNGNDINCTFTKDDRGYVISASKGKDTYNFAEQGYCFDLINKDNVYSITYINSDNITTVCSFGYIYGYIKSGTLVKLNLSSILLDPVYVTDSEIRFAGIDPEKSLLHYVILLKEGNKITYQKLPLSSSGGGIDEAPIDGKTYARKDQEWTEVKNQIEVISSIPEKLDTNKVYILTNDTPSYKTNVYKVSKAEASTGMSVNSYKFYVTEVGTGVRYLDGSKEKIEEYFFGGQEATVIRMINAATKKSTSDKLFSFYDSSKRSIYLITKIGTTGNDMAIFHVIPGGGVEIFSKELPTGALITSLVPDTAIQIVNPTYLKISRDAVTKLVPLIEIPEVDENNVVEVAELPEFPDYTKIYVLTKADETHKAGVYKATKNEAGAAVWNTIASDSTDLPFTVVNSIPSEVEEDKIYLLTKKDGDKVPDFYKATKIVEEKGMFIGGERKDTFAAVDISNDLSTELFGVDADNITPVDCVDFFAKNFLCAATDESYSQFYIVCKTKVIDGEQVRIAIDTEGSNVYLSKIDDSDIPFDDDVAIVAIKSAGLIIDNSVFRAAGGDRTILDPFGNFKIAKDTTDVIDPNSIYFIYKEGGKSNFYRNIVTPAENGITFGSYKYKFKNFGSVISCEHNNGWMIGATANGTDMRHALDAYHLREEYYRIENHLGFEGNDVSVAFYRIYSKTNDKCFYEVIKFEEDKIRLWYPSLGDSFNVGGSKSITFTDDWAETRNEILSSFRLTFRVPPDEYTECEMVEVQFPSESNIEPIFEFNQGGPDTSKRLKLKLKCSYKTNTVEGIANPEDVTFGNLIESIVKYGDIDLYISTDEVNPEESIPHSINFKTESSRQYVDIMFMYSGANANGFIGACRITDNLYIIPSTFGYIYPKASTVNVFTVQYSGIGGFSPTNVIAYNDLKDLFSKVSGRESDFVATNVNGNRIYLHPNNEGNISKLYAYDTFGNDLGKYEVTLNDTSKSVKVTFVPFQPETKLEAAIKENMKYGYTRDFAINAKIDGSGNITYDLLTIE